MLNNCLDSFVQIYKAPFWLFVVAIGLFMILYDSKILMRKSDTDAMVVKTIGWVYIIGGTLIFIIIKTMR